MGVPTNPSHNSVLRCVCKDEYGPNPMPHLHWCSMPSTSASGHKSAVKYCAAMCLRLDFLLALEDKAVPTVEDQSSAKGESGQGRAGWVW